MTVIAWDGTTLATDRQATTCGMRRLSCKMRRLSNGTVLAWTGDSDVCHLLANWYADGADPAKWPATQATDDWSRLVVLDADGLRFYEKHPVALPVLDSFTAFGCGRDFAMGALAMGADARRAVEITGEFSTGCGMGVDTMQYEPMPGQP